MAGAGAAAIASQVERARAKARELLVENADLSATLAETESQTASTYVAMTALRAQVDSARANAAQARLGADAATVDLEHAMRVQQGHVDAAKAEVIELRGVLKAREDALVKARADAAAAVMALEQELRQELTDAKRETKRKVKQSFVADSTHQLEQTRQLLERTRRRQEHGFRNAMRNVQNERREACAGWMDEERKFAEYSAFAETLLQDSKAGLEELRQERDQSQGGGASGGYAGVTGLPFVSFGFLRKASVEDSEEPCKDAAAEEELCKVAAAEEDHGSETALTANEHECTCQPEVVSPASAPEVPESSLASQAKG